MRIKYRLFSSLFSVMILLIGVIPVSAKSESHKTRQVINEPVTWTLTPGTDLFQCQAINAVINGSGQRHEVITTQTNEDGGTTTFYDDKVTGTATDVNGNAYKFLYVNHARYVTPATGTPVSIQMQDLFVLTGNNQRANNLRVAFNWSWTYDPQTSSYWPPVDNFVKKFTHGNPYGCDPI